MELNGVERDGGETGIVLRTEIESYEVVRE